jgi:hypothetical protein
VPESIGAGAMQVVLPGRIAKPETILLADNEDADDNIREDEEETDTEESAAEEIDTEESGTEERAEEKELAGDGRLPGKDVAVDEPGVLFELPPPPQATNPIKLVISRHFFTQVFIEISSQTISQPNYFESHNDALNHPIQSCYLVTLLLIVHKKSQHMAGLYNLSVAEFIAGSALIPG